MTILTAVIGGTALGLMVGVGVGVLRKLRDRPDGDSETAQESTGDDR